MQNGELIQEFECLVIRSNDKIVECEIHDLTQRKPVEYAEIYRSSFKNFDSSLLTEGRVFYWKIFQQQNEKKKLIQNHVHEFQLR